MENKLYVAWRSGSRACLLSYRFLSFILWVFVFEWLTGPLVMAQPQLQSPLGLPFQLSQYESAQSGSDLSLLNRDGDTYFRGAYSPNFELGPVELGVDLKLYIPTNKHNLPSEFNSFALRHVAFKTDIVGFTWGRLRNVTLGYGLLMDRYDSGNWGSTDFATEKAGVLGYVVLDRVRVDGMWTPNHLSAGRVTYTEPKTMVFGSPMVIGATYVTDTDGVERDESYRKKQEGYSADIAFPIGGDFLTFYSEYTQLSSLDKRGPQGISAGFKGDLLTFASFRFEYRDLGQGFIPGYFNSTYEATSADLAQDGLDQRASGFLGSLAVPLNDVFKAGVSYEAYDIKHVLTAGLGWEGLFGTTGVVNYIRPFNGDDRTQLSSDLILNTHSPIQYTLSYKRVYTTDNDFNDYYGFGGRLQLGRLFGF